MVERAPIKVTVTGAAGQIGYSLLFRLAAGEAFGVTSRIQLCLLEIEPAMKALEGVVMELEDCAFPLVSGISYTSDVKSAFEGCQWAILVGAVPRKEGMERRDLLGVNAKIFAEQGASLEAGASEDVRVLVVGNPCNTNCLIARSHAPSIPDERFFAMMALDESRAKHQLAKKAGVPVSLVRRMAVWGNHSTTQFPDFYHAVIGDTPVTALIDEDWLKSEFLTTVQQRGAAIIRARGASSAGSAANAVIYTIRNIVSNTAEGDWFSVASVSHGEYGVPEGLIFGFPTRTQGGRQQIVEGLEHGEFAQERLRATTEELEEERAEVKSLGLLT
jgi:malate dehydrogenase